MNAASRIVTSVEEARRLGVTPESARHALWRAGDLSYLLHEGQMLLRHRWRSSSSRRYVGNIGRGWGKSFWGCLESVECAIRTPNAQVRYAAPEAKQVETIIAPHMRQILEHGPPDLRPAYNAQRGTWTFPNGSVIFVAGANAGGADRLRGVSTDLAIIDEARDIDCLDYLVKSVLTPRITERGRILIISTPPEVPDHALVRYITEAQARGAYMHAPTSEAPHVSEARMAEFLADYTGPDDPAFRREFLAEIIVDPARVVLPELSEHEATTVREHPRPSHFLPTIVGDLGYEDWTVIAFGYYDFAADLDVIEHELVLSRTRSDLIDAEATRIAGELWGSLPVHARRIDAQPIVRADMGRAHARAEDEPEVWQATRNDDMRAAANAMRVRISRGRLRIHPRCTTIIAHGKYARWNRARTGLERPSEAEHHYDGCAALLYFGRELDRLTNPFPVPEPTTIDRFRAHRLEQTEAQKLRGIFRRSAR